MKLTLPKVVSTSYNKIVTVHSTVSKVISQVNKTKTAVHTTKNTIQNTKKAMTLMKNFSKERDAKSLKALIRMTQ